MRTAQNHSVERRGEIKGIPAPASARVTALGDLYASVRKDLLPWASVTDTPVQVAEEAILDLVLSLIQTEEE